LIGFIFPLDFWYCAEKNQKSIEGLGERLVLEWFTRTENSNVESQRETDKGNLIEFRQC
jgi:hypothetical protein